MAERILAVRAKISAKILDNGDVQLDLSALTDPDRAIIKEARIVSDLLLEFDPQPFDLNTIALIRERLDHDVGEVQQKVDDLISSINRTGRQEERIALLISAILDDPAVGESALLQYPRDRAKFANWALHELKQMFIQGQRNRISDQQLIAALVPKLVTSGLMHSDDSQGGGSSSISRHESRDCRQGNR